MSQNTSQPEVAPLVTVEDLSERCPECGMTASEHAAFPSLRRLCSQTPGKILLAHWERIVRREMAAELDRLAEEQQAIADSHGTYPMEAPFHAAFARHLTTRAEAIRNG